MPKRPPKPKKEHKPGKYPGLSGNSRQRRRTKRIFAGFGYAHAMRSKETK